MNIYDNLAELCDIVGKEINRATETMSKAGNKLSPGDVEYLDKLTHMLKSIKTTMAMMDADGFSSRGSYDDRSYDDRSYRNRSYARGRYAKRDSMGRYSSADRSYDDGFVEKMHELVNEAPDDRMRQKLQRMVDEM